MVLHFIRPSALVIDSYVGICGSVGWGIAQQSRLTALLNSSGEFGLEWELEQDAPLRFRWSLSASYAGIVSPFRGEGQEESQIATECTSTPLESGSCAKLFS
jgi:hypothetical protein